MRDEYLPYKHVIGQIILDVSSINLMPSWRSRHPLTYAQKVIEARTVVNKLDTIQNKFRVFDMELLAGEPDYIDEHVCTSFIFAIIS